MRFLVRIDFQRVQTFLFAVPRLRDMVGANVLLGEMMREHLPQLALAKNAIGISSPPPGLPGRNPDDFLVDDDPSELYRQGVLVRDGGHFAACFSGELEAVAFRRATQAKLLEELPGLPFSIHVGPLASNEDTKGEEPGEHDAASRQEECNGNREIWCGEPGEQYLFDLPQFQVCEQSGNGPAERRDKKAGTWTSRAVSLRRRAYVKFRRHRSRDIIGLIDRKLPGTRPPKDFEELCGTDYLAVVYADCNDLGMRSEHQRGTLPKEPTEEQVLEREARGETFFHATRVALRRATKRALEETYKPKLGEVRPYQLLMLGGDDFLMVCRAKMALPFVVAFARALKKCCINGIEPPTIGAGVAIASHKMPFHHLHHVAEELVGSAKRLYRRLDEDKATASVIDWVVTTGSTCSDPIALRRETALVRYNAGKDVNTLALTRKPMRILHDESLNQSCFRCLECLLGKAGKMNEAIDREKIARSQLRRIVEELAKGKLWSERIYNDWRSDLFQEERNLLPDPLWKAGDDTPHSSTALADLVEIAEIENLRSGRR